MPDSVMIEKMNTKKRRRVNIFHQYFKRLYFPELQYFLEIDSKTHVA